MNDTELLELLDQPKLQMTPQALALTPARVQQMIDARQDFQLAKFRTTCTDCVPNY
ncbi:MAG: hypothetical protein JO287_20355 [Pseudonocardiales bacterium]|nr:hypothetical protein [Pseudonocardiales bacterium]